MMKETTIKVKITNDPTTAEKLWNQLHGFFVNQSPRYVVHAQGGHGGEGVTDHEVTMYTEHSPDHGAGGVYMSFKERDRDADED